MTALEHARSVVESWDEELRRELPENAYLFDAHTNIGNDIDGMVGDRDELLQIQRAYGISRSFVFCLDEPDRTPAFSAANDRSLAHAAAAPGD